MFINSMEDGKGDPRLLKIVKIQGLDPTLLLIVNTKSRQAGKWAIDS
jgi:hypothetical protein